ncbi:mip family channel protein [Stylonychia lemnae]|uniref:Mip family channel protein n=1 Tax=Stylonychia lemnae TaxID=5949 RepID=A0A078ARB5_STYLE|nr:mip family channel protein [Stylonychia lemnae]|eukprot:CDW84764.1 mip family channel protein [Stylonychia lemnae]
MHQHTSIWYIHSNCSDLQDYWISFQRWNKYWYFHAWKKKVPILVTYIISQIFGVYFGMVFSYLVLGHDQSLNLHPPDNQNQEIYYVFLTEMFFSWIFMTVYLHAKTSKIAPSTDPGLRAITMMVVQYVNSGMIMPVTGGCLNPTIGFCAVTFRAIVTKHSETSYMKYLPAYLFGPLIAGFLAGAFVRYVALVVAPESPDSAPPEFNTSKQQLNDSRSTHGGAAADYYQIRNNHD